MIAVPENVSCPVCSDVQVRTRYASVRDYITNDEFAVLACASCGVAFTYPTPTDMNRHYPASYRAYRQPVVSVLGLLYSARARTWTRGFDRPGDVLEIGCGPGLMLKAMRDLGWRTTGLERSEEAAAYGRREYDLNILATSIEDLPLECRYDLIVLFQVLEHMSDPARLIDLCFRRLRPGGRISISVPNFVSWQAEFGREVWMHLDVPRHLFHFSPHSLDFVLRRAGFQDLTFQYVALEHDPFGWVQTTLNRLISPSNTLLRYLMHLDANKTKVALSLGMAALLTLPSLGLSMASSTVGRGGIVSVMASRGA